MVNASGHKNAQAYDQALTAALLRVKAEFLEMPGLQLTRNQAARLWGFDRELCDTVLSTLVEERFLICTRSASFVRAAEGRLRPES
jgi:hypothetical protein